MKKILYTIAIGLVSNLVLAQTTTENYIKNTTPQVEVQSETVLNTLNSDNKIETITYFDGLGRAKQSISMQLGGQKQDIITPVVYDEFGRLIKEYLPYARVYTSGEDALRYEATNLIFNLNQQYLTKYANDLTGVVNPYSEKVLEASPLGRVMEQAAPGSDWAVGNDHTIKLEYTANTLNPSNPFDNANNVYDNVIHFDVTHPNNDNEQTELVFVGHYAASELYRTVTKDENWTSGKDHTTEEFKNKKGQVILKRTYESNDPHDAYYVYDDYGNLTYVLPPQASDEILTQDTAGRVASQVNYPWISLVNVDKNFAEEYNKKLIDYDNADILNADIENAYGGQGGFTVSTLENSEQVLLSINFSATQALSLKKGELVSLKDYGSHKDTELGRISGDGYSYTFFIKNNTIHIDGDGKLNGINQVFDSTSKLAYDQDYLWTNLVNIDKKFASAHESEVLAHAKNTGQNPLNVYLENEYGGQGGLNITIDENDNMVLSFNISSTTPLELKQGIVLSLNTKRRFDNRYLGTLSGNGYSYNFELRDNSIVISGSGTGQSFAGIFFPNPPAQDDFIIRTEVIEGLCYIYHYDHRNRLIEKKIPGKGWEHIVYDKLDRPVLTQDTKQRLDNEWLFTKYDAFGRITYTGKHLYIPQANDHNSGRLELQGDLNAQTDLHEVRQSTGSSLDGTTIYYSNQCIPTTNLKLFTINYYDDYSNLGLSAELLKNNGDIIYDEAIDTDVKSLVVCSKVKVLDTDDWITSVTYYDDRARPIYNASKNDYLNSLDIVESDLDFVGKVLQTKILHTKDSNSTITIEDSFTYDHTGRLLTQTQTINGSPAELIVNNHYDEFGQLEGKDIGGAAAINPEDSNGLQTLDYTYNIRGWLKEINNPSALGNDLFGFKINYNSPEQSINSLYNGNISETFWKTANDNKLRGYDYMYDTLNRIETANYHGNYTLVDNSTELEDYGLSNITYDKNGNLFSLNRMGVKESSHQIDVIDALNYSYTPLSNQLINVFDTASEDGFKDGAITEDNDYLYDINGNMVKDLNKGIVDIQYNHLNLPYFVSIPEHHQGYTDDNRIQYVYDALGNKLSKTVWDYNNYDFTRSLTEYNGIFIYEYSSSSPSSPTPKLRHIQTSEGYFSILNPYAGVADGEYVYQYKDHLGNIRLTYADSDGNGSIDSSTEIIEENNYYPFGLEHKGYNNVVSSNANNIASKFKYNGKELEEEQGKDTYAYGWRDYDPAIGRFNKIDRFAEKYYNLSTYSYAGNNPIMFIDVQGDSISEGSQRKFDRLQRKVERTRNRLERKRNRIDRRATKRGWSVEKRMAKQGNLASRIAHLNSTVMNLNDLESSTQFYRLESGAGEVGGTTYDPATGEVVISYSNAANFVHESTHAGQFESKDIAFDNVTGNTYAQDLGDESEAYRAQYAFKPKSVSRLNSTSQVSSFGDITNNWVQGIRTSSGATPYGLGGSANTGIVTVDINSTRADLIRAYPNNAATLRTLPVNFTLQSLPTIYYKR